MIVVNYLDIFALAQLLAGLNCMAACSENTISQVGSNYNLNSDGCMIYTFILRFCILFSGIEQLCRMKMWRPAWFKSIGQALTAAMTAGYHTIVFVNLRFTISKSGLKPHTWTVNMYTEITQQFDITDIYTNLRLFHQNSFLRKKVNLE